MKLKKTPLFLPVLLSLSLIFSSCNSVKTAGESSKIAGDTSSLSSIKETEISSTKNDTISNPSGAAESLSNISGEKDLFNINRINGIISASKRKFPDNYYYETWNHNQMSNYLGIDLKGIGAALEDKLKTDIAEYYSVVYNEHGDIFYDIFRVRFIGENDIQIAVSASKQSKPHGSLYKLESEEKTSLRMGDSGEIIPVLVAAQNKNESTGEYDLCVADFEYSGVNYRIEAKNLPIDNIDRVIRKIANQAY